MQQTQAATLAGTPVKDNSPLVALLERILGNARTERLLRILVIPPALLQGAPTDVVSRAQIAQVLNMLLFEDLVARVPAAANYVERALREGRTILHDHGAVRTVALAGMGTLPPGQDAIVRLLEPLGYALNGTYPLDRLKMTGRSYAQVDLPEQIAQFFVSELHVDRFSPEFAAAVQHVTTSSVDPLTAEASQLLAKVGREGKLSQAEAAALLPALVACFARQHGVVALADYEVLLRESAEMAWISTEGNSFNHVTDRVPDVDALTVEEKALGQPIKDVVERSKTDRVRQTAYTAACVERSFLRADGTTETRIAPGSFLEFITRLPIPEENRLDLAFDSSNAQGIFKMTESAGC